VHAVPSTLFDRIPDPPTDEALLDAFLAWVEDKGLQLYPAQEEAILALWDGQNVILGTPTGSGKSLVATALAFAALARGRRFVYTCPVKALVNEKWMDLCRTFGPEQVGLATGDATVNREAPILCCTAEILANMALGEGAQAPVQDAVLDEFHFYADRDRGWAWQVPLLTLPQTRFLLMSATLGDVRFFQEALTRLNGRPTAHVASGERPVPLAFAYAETPLPLTLERLLEAGRAPIYVVHFTQADAATNAQSFTSLNLCTKEERERLAKALEGFRFSSPYGPDLKRWLRQGIGLHHAGLLPKYRILVEQLAQQGLLKVICGTDTLGVGINVPIRTVLLTQLCKYDGQKTSILSARDFHQIAGRAGRKGFDDRGYVVAQAPEHVIENLRLAAKAAGGGRKFVKRQPPERGYVHWDEQTFQRLIASPPERLQSRFQVNHGLILKVLGRSGDGCRALRELLRNCHETEASKVVLRRRTWQLFRTLVERGIVELQPPDDPGRKLRVNVDLQEDFSMDHALSLYLLDTIPLLDADHPDYPLDLLSLVEAILEDPDPILRKQLERLKAQVVADLKAAGIPYEQRMEELEKLEHPKPLRDFIYDTFNAFAEQHPWVGQEAIRPKSIAREMAERYCSFGEYVRLYGLQRVEGLLLRHLNSAYKVLAQTVPETAKTEPVRELEAYLGALVRSVDASLLEAWERLKDPAYVPKALEEPELKRPADLTKDRSRLLAEARARIFTWLTALRDGAWEEAVAALDEAACAEPLDLEGEPWTPERLQACFEAYRTTHEGPRLDPEGRNLRHTYVYEDPLEPAWLHLEQMIVDFEGVNDWVAVFRIDLDDTRERNRPVMDLVRVGPLV